MKKAIVNANGFTHSVPVYFYDNQSLIAQEDVPYENLAKYTIAKCHELKVDNVSVFGSANFVSGIKEDMDTENVSHAFSDNLNIEIKINE